MKLDLSVIIPSIRIQNLEKIHFMLEKAIEPYQWEMIIVGPYQIPESLEIKGNVRFLKDFGSPSRCVQLGSAIAQGKNMMWMSDDCTYISPQSLAQCVELLDSCGTQLAGVTLRYFEGNGQGEFPEDYWRAKHHGDMQKLDGVDDCWKIAPLGMYRTSDFKNFGGLNCQYEHINMCTHDLAFRMQRAGGKILLSPKTVASFYWSWHTEDAKPVQRAYFETDNPLFSEKYSKPQNVNDNPKHIDYNNWMDCEDKWSKRFV